MITICMISKFLKRSKKTFSSIAVGLCLILTASLSMAKDEDVMKENDPIRLPEPKREGDMSLERAIAERRSERSYRSKQLSQEEISQILWSAQGITSDRGYRAAPSAGGLYPMELYAATEEGVFHYKPRKHRLRILAKTDLREELSQAALGQAWVREAPMVVVLCAVYERVTSKYGQRGIRYVHMEAGHIAQNIHLQAEVLGLGSVPVGAFNAKDVRSLLSLPADQEPVYIIPVGYVR